MAFSLFKKKTYADIVYMNGHVYTQDAQFPWASAVACSGNRIMAVGDFDGMDEIIDEDTEIVDLESRYMFPGFLDVRGTPVLEIFKDSYFHIDSQWDTQSLLDILSDYIETCEGDIVFGYGFHEKLLDDYASPDETHLALDQIEADRPVLLLAIDGTHCWMNTLASEIVTTASTEDDMEYLTVDYVLHVLSPFTIEEIEASLKEYTETLADKGITSLFNLYAPDYFTELFLNALFTAVGEENAMMEQRFHNSTYVNRPFHPQIILHRLLAAKTTCIELGHLITSDFLKLEVSEQESSAIFSQEALNQICLEAAEHGFHIHLDAKDQVSRDKAVKTFSLLREKGYKNNVLVLASDDHAASPDDESFISTWSTNRLNESVLDHAASVHDAIDGLTLTAAESLGLSKVLGSIEKGKYADFTVFSENPLDGTLKRFSTMHADMTILDGQIVYDAEESAADEMCDILFSMQL